VSLAERLMRRFMPLPEVLEPPRPVPVKPEWERIAEEVIDARAQEPEPEYVTEPPDRIVFGSVPRVSGRGW
jgi:hypothetical protein